MVDDCLDAFQWLAQEIRQAGGEVLVMRVEQFEGWDDARLIGLFNQTKAEEYTELERQFSVWEAQSKQESPAVSQTGLERLQKQHAEIARTDYFQSPEGIQLAARLRQAAQNLFPNDTAISEVQTVSPEDYRGRKWVTRPRPHVDRLASIWLIRQFIDPDAIIRFSDQPEPDEIAFDMPDSHFGHVGNLCTFETMMRAFSLTSPALYPLAEIVHEVDLWDGRYPRPEAVGVNAVLRGWLKAGLTDAELVENGLVLFDGLFAILSPGVLSTE